MCADRRRRLPAAAALSAEFGEAGSLSDELDGDISGRFGSDDSIPSWMTPPGEVRGRGGSVGGGSDMDDA